MVAGNVLLQIEKGCTFQRTLQWKDSNGNPINMTGYTALMLIQSADQQTNFTLSTVNGRIVITPSTGTLVLTIAAANTENFTFTNGQYELRVTDGSGIVTRLLIGGITVIPGVIP